MEDGFVSAYGRNATNYILGIYINDTEVFHNTFVSDPNNVQYSPLFRVRRGDKVVWTNEPSVMYECGLQVFK